MLQSLRETDVHAAFNNEALRPYLGWANGLERQVDVAVHSTTTLNSAGRAAYNHVADTLVDDKRHFVTLATPHW